MGRNAISEDIAKIEGILIKPIGSFNSPNELKWTDRIKGLLNRTEGGLNMAGIINGLIDRQDIGAQLYAKQKAIIRTTVDRLAKDGAITVVSGSHPIALNI